MSDCPRDAYMLRIADSARPWASVAEMPFGRRSGQAARSGRVSRVYAGIKPGAFGIRLNDIGDT
jgi:hypothetical protein